MRSVRFLTSLSLAMLCLFTCSFAVAAETPEELYKNNKVTLLLGTGAGGGSDLGGRIIAKHWPEFGGNDMIVKNMPGGGGIVAVNYLVNSCRPDGLTMHMMMFGSSYQLPYLTKNRAAKYDASRLQYVLGAYQEPWVLVASKKFKSLEDIAKAGNITYGIMNPLEGNNFAMLPILEALQLKAKVVTGYKSQQEALLAVAKGEVDITMGPVSQVMREVNQGVLQKPFLLLERERLPLVPDIPTFFEVIDVTSEIDALYEQCRPLCMAVRMMALPEETPAEIVEYLRDVFTRMAASEAFEADARKAFLLGGNCLTGKELQDFIQTAFSVDFTAIMERLNKYSQ
ncbi:tripartite tricarboxylate transporter substrate binding protein [Mailhella massiliensis]|uniref:Tripartite tricarboxylate transporter substrate binding protein n=1 Tax=Mailhella massiliensis TaxID=1903261 RepID=A0A921AWI7_9BACT|nr:tripartite tricarboxylate transporter substrate-binding protein [Mailhella massiliensis]HJD97063.1 hypothetical protein [Mailhella massiliensis]